tara:strand:+ start:10555 stop:12720 length:2166 start_codon:yes stop_codon:yes gene_type:complete
MNGPSPYPPIRARTARLVMLLTVVVLTTLGILLMTDFIFRVGFTSPRLIFLILFGILFTLVTTGSAHAFWGFWVRRTRGLKSRIVRASEEVPDTNVTHAGRTALVFPVYNEDPQRVFAGIEAVFEDLNLVDPNHDVDIYILSDSTNPDNWVKEEMAWVQLCRQVEGFGRIFYRRRAKNVNRKAGNIADFCTKWGGDYAYMITMDADSIVSGKAILQLIGMMDRRPTAGLIQTAPRLFGGQSFFARVQQFAARFYGPIFLAGLDWWQGAAGNYWGHNAIIRLAPFTDYCDLPDLPGKEPFGGKILSHDFVEAALMVKAGWEVLLAYDIEDSWEEGPPSLIDHAKRDRRWMQGNLQHTWLLFARRIHSCNWVHLLMGIAGYLSSCIWFCFLMLSLWIAWLDKSSRVTLFPVDGFVGAQLHLDVRTHGLIIFLYTICLLFSPKVLAIIDLILCQRLREFGGLIRALMSSFIETLFFTLIAPILMLFHTKFFFWLIVGRSVSWSTQNRESTGTSWGEAARTHGGQTVFGAVFILISLWLDPQLFWWMIPINAGLVLSIPLSVWSSSEKLGRWFASLGFFRTPESFQPAKVLTEIEPDIHNFDTLRFIFPEADHSGITAAIVDPYVNALHVTLLKQPTVSEAGQASDDKGDRLMTQGPKALTREETLETLSDPDLMQQLHRRVWSRSSGKHTGWWRYHVEMYRTSEWMKKRSWIAPNTARSGSGPR